MTEIISVENDRRKKRLILQKLERYGVLFEVDEAFKATGRGFLSSDFNKIKDKRFHLMSASPIYHSLHKTHSSVNLSA